MNKKATESELILLRKRVEELEKVKEQQAQIESELKSLNQQLDANNQQLQASEQQLQANELELKKKQIEAQEAREFAENIINTVRQPLLVLDRKLKVVTANQYFYKLFEVTKKDTLGSLFYELGNHQWDIPKLKDLLKKTLPEKSTIEDFEVDHKFEGIGHKIMLLNARELKQEHEKEQLILIAIEDVTLRKKYELELIRLNRELEQKAEELQQILYITTHDLRSPLVNIQGFTSEMEASVKEMQAILKNASLRVEIANDLKDIMENEIPEAIHYITTSTTKMDNLLKGLLALSRLGRQKLYFKELDMNRLINEVLDNYEFEIKEQEVEIECNELPPCTGDELQMNQVFSNLIGNSLKFFDSERNGKIKISGKKQPKGNIYIVEDNGIGISPEYRKKIFGLFEKLHPNKQGIGLGLNIVKQVVERHNGTIHLESELGEGTKFSIFIPS